MHSSVTIVGILIGIAILFFGRRLFWLCVAAAGFAVGVKIAPLLVNEASPMALVIALVFGVLGALLALFLQKVAIGVLGFLAGAKLATEIAAAFFVNSAQYSTIIIFVIGGIIGAILLLALFGWALIVVSSFIGAYLIVFQDAIVLPPKGSTIVFTVLAIVGIFVQAASFRRSAI